MDKIDVESTSSHSATCSDIILRSGRRVRLIFRPEIVDNPENPEARVRGRFIYQRKSDSESWEAVEKVSLASLEKGEGFQLELHSNEVLTLRHDLYELARLHREVGIPQGHAQFLRPRTLADRHVGSSTERVMRYEVDAEGFFTPLTADQIAELFAAGRLRKRCGRG